MATEVTGGEANGANVQSVEKTVTFTASDDEKTVTFTASDDEKTVTFTASDDEKTVTFTASDDEKTVTFTASDDEKTVKSQVFVEASKVNDAVLFYKSAFGAEEVNRVSQPKRNADQEMPLLQSAEIKLGSASIILPDVSDDDKHYLYRSDQEMPLLQSVEIKPGSASIILADASDDDKVKTVGSGVVSCLETDIEGAVDKAVKPAAEERLSEVAKAQTDKHKIYNQSIGKDGGIERLSLEAAELKKSKSQLLQLIEHKDLEINEKISSIKGFLHKIISLTEASSAKELRINKLEAEHSRVYASLARLSQEKELVERHNLWLNDELTSKVKSFWELTKVHNELEADMSSKLADLERTYNEASSSLKWKDDKVKEIESKLEALQNELCSSKDATVATEERLSAELYSVNKLVELHKENSDEWSKKAGELKGVIKALETHASQVEKDYKERLDKETSTRIEFEKEASRLKEKLEKCEAELENFRNSDQVDLLQLGSYNTKAYEDYNLMVVPSIPAGISGTALAASLLGDGWTLDKVYEKYQEAVNDLRHEQLGRKQSESILKYVMDEIEAKVDAIRDERAEHGRLSEAYDELSESLQHSRSEQSALEREIQELKAELRESKRCCNIFEEENTDLTKQVTLLLKETRDIRVRDGESISDSERLLTFEDINELVKHNVYLNSRVRELKKNFDDEMKNHTNATASKVNAVLARAEEQTQMVESLQTSVAMYKKLYDEEHKRHLTQSQLSHTPPKEIRNNYDASTRAQEKAFERIKLLEEEATCLRQEIVKLKTQNNKFSLEASFAHEKYQRFMKDIDHQREETNRILSSDVELKQLIVDYKRQIREASEANHIAKELSRKLTMEVDVLKRQKEASENSEKQALEEVRSMTERLQQLQATMNTIQSAEEIREEARSASRMLQEDYVKRAEREWADAMKELQEERDNSRKLALEHEYAMQGSMQCIEEMSKELANALRAVNDANARASAAEELLSQFQKSQNLEVNNENALVTTTKTAIQVTSSMAETISGNQDGSVVSIVSTSGPTEVKPKEPVADTVSRTRKLRSSSSLAGNQQSPAVGRGRGKIPTATANLNEEPVADTASRTINLKNIKLRSSLRLAGIQPPAVGSSRGRTRQGRTRAGRTGRDGPASGF